MGLLNFLFGKKNRKENNVKDEETEKIFLKYPAGTQDESMKTDTKQESAKETPKHDPVSKEASNAKFYGTEIRPLEGCKQLCFEIFAQDSSTSEISGLGTPNPDYKLDELALRRKGYLFENVYAYKFKPMDATLTADAKYQDDPDAVLVSVNGVDVGYLLGHDGAQISWFLEAGLVRRVKATICGGDYLTLDCDAEYDETSKRIPKDCLYIDEDTEKYSITVCIDVEKSELDEFIPKKQKIDFPGVSTKALPGCKQQRFQVAGESYHMQEILSLGKLSADFMMSKSELKDKGLLNVPIQKYTFPPLLVNLVPEPTNGYDKNAIQVFMGGKLVGYIPKKRCAQLLDDMSSGKVIRIQGGIVCREVRTLYTATNSENDLLTQKMRIFREDGGIIVKLFIDVLANA